MIHASQTIDQTNLVVVTSNKLASISSTIHFLVYCDLDVDCGSVVDSE